LVQKSAFQYRRNVDADFWTAILAGG
jgi:hypothetical protein